MTLDTVSTSGAQMSTMASPSVATGVTGAANPELIDAIVTAGALPGGGFVMAGGAVAWLVRSRSLRAATCASRSIDLISDRAICR
jgi:hypothetical protein